MKNLIYRSFNKTNRNLSLGAAMAAALAVSGCTIRQAYPETQIKGYIDGKPFTIQAPKDSTLNGFDASASTNGVHVHIDSLTTSLNPTNVANVATGQAGLVTATGQAITQGIQAAAAAAGTFAGAAAKN